MAALVVAALAASTSVSAVCACKGKKEFAILAAIAPLMPGVPLALSFAAWHLLEGDEAVSGGLTLFVTGLVLAVGAIGCLGYAFTQALTSARPGSWWERAASRAKALITIPGIVVVALSLGVALASW